MKRAHAEEHTVSSFASNFSLFEQALQLTSFTAEEYAKIVAFCQQKADSLTKGERETTLSTFLSNVTIDSFYAEVGEVDASEKTNEINQEILNFLHTFNVSSADLTEEDDVYAIFVFTIEGNFNNHHVKFVFRHKNAGGFGSFYFKEYHVDHHKVDRVNEVIGQLGFSKKIKKEIFFRVLDFVFRNTYPLEWDDLSFAYENN